MTLHSISIAVRTGASQPKSRSFSKKRQKSEREKLAATKSSLLVPEKSDSSRVNPTSPAAPELQSPRFDLTKAMHQGMSEWDWRRRVDARLDRLVRQHCA